jgi:hypothetical protein
VLSVADPSASAGKHMALWGAPSKGTPAGGSSAEAPVPRRIPPRSFPSKGGVRLLVRVGPRRRAAQERTKRAPVRYLLPQILKKIASAVQLDSNKGEQCLKCLSHPRG